MGYPAENRDGRFSYGHYKTWPDEKLRLYERSGVREYWTIDPAGRWLRTYELREAGYGPGTLFEEKGRVESAVLSVPGGRVFEIRVEELFGDLDRRTAKGYSTAT
jgi:Uma2 family endonuclease